MEHVLSHGQTDRPSGDKFDFYHDPRVQEAVQCRPVLEHLRLRIADLLNQWPGHASLLDVAKLIDRILSFAIDSPIMKLVTGLEMLLTKCHEWEANAHRGVSISEDIHAMSHLILRWRTLELDCWKMCLDNVERRSAAAAAKYWFHLYSTITSLLNDKGGTSDLTSVQSTLRQFMESATLGQYEARLRMLRAFACHVTLSGGQEQLLRLLWHALLFYGQFLPVVVKRKASLRQPIDKKVRDFIKIMRWNDINYYALKEAVHRAHGTLHKHMKEWRDVLEQPARTVLNEPGVDLETEAAASSLLPIPVEPFIGNAQSMTGFDVISLASHSVLSRLPSLYTKSLNLCGKTLRKCPFQRRIRAVDDLVGTVISSVNQLQKLKIIGNGADKEKQKNEAKAISMRKRKSLFQLFRSLQQMGISYRKGAFLWSQESGLASLELVLPVLAVEASLEHLPERPSHSAIRLAWDKGPHYYTRCLARLSASAKLLEKPSSELGPSTVERLKGFAAQFMAIIQDQWKCCSATMDKLVRLRMLTTQLDGLRTSSSQLQVPESALVIYDLDHLWQLVVDALAVMEEFESLMNACPPGGFDVVQLRLDDNCTKLVTKDVASSLLSLRAKLVTNLMVVRQDLEKQFHLYRISSAPSWLFSNDQWNCISRGFKTLEDSQGLLEEMASIAGSQNYGSTVELIRRRFSIAVQEFKTRENPVQNFEPKIDATDVDKLCQSVLHGIQEIYKKYAETTVENKKEESDEEDDFEVDHLTSKLMTELNLDLSKILKLDGTMAELSRLVDLAKDHSRHALLLSQCAPVFDQYVFVVEFYFSSQLATLRTSCKLQSVLLNVFNQLLEKGFCLPSELDDSKEGAAGTRFEENESGGLGEGEGAKDVSDQIEDEDQLDTARQQGQEEEKDKNEDQNGPKEEENGIEMSEDFDAELQDREKEEGEDGDDDDSGKDEDDEDDLDKEMGDTGEGADQLEEKLWGSDEEDGDESDQDQEEGQGDGEKKESEMTAKQGEDEEKDEDGENEKGRDKKKEKPKNMEDDDDENVNDDQIDPYHTSQEPPPEPEPLDVPDDLNLDGGDAKDKEEGDEGDAADENPFDIDAMKNETELDEDEEKGKEEESTNPEGIEEDAPDESAESKENDQKPKEGDEEEEGGEQENEEKEMEEPDASDNPQQAESNQAVPSMDQPSQTEAQPAAEESVKGSQDKTARKDTADNKPEEDGGQNQEADNEDVEGIGMAESRQNQGHEGEEKSKVNRKTVKDQKEDEAKGQGKPRKPGQSDPNRALAEERKQRVLQVNFMS